MKKNISINISGIVFHIEDDAYEVLKNYLDEINHYFSNYEDSQEIVNDIESRVAEIFIETLSQDKKSITLEDVDSLKMKMGNIDDFQTIEQDHENDNKATNSRSNKSYSNQAKSFFRDGNRKVLGGVCSGIANYFNLDVVWIRLALILLLVVSWGTVFLVYFILWATVPLSDELNSDNEKKKLFRDADNKILSGVSSGVANYFGLDPTIIRLCFIFSFFFGFLLYIILWIITPQAKTISDKIRMKGKKVTLSSIESNIKESFNIDNNQEENNLVKILLFPFRILAQVLEALSKVLTPFLRIVIGAIRIVFGVLMFFIPLFATIVILISILGIVGVFSNDFTNTFFLTEWVQFDLFSNLFSWSLLLGIFLVTITPLVLMMLIGISIIFRDLFLNKVIGWILLVGFFVGLLIMTFNVSMILYHFNKDAQIVKTDNYSLSDKTVILQLSDEDYYDAHTVKLKIRGYNGNDYKLEKYFYAKGSTIKSAKDNAKMINYNLVQNDSIITFDKNFTFNQGATYRAQDLKMTLYVPYGAKFVMKNGLKEILNNTIYRSGYSVSDLGDNLWMIDREGLYCITCDNNEQFNRANHNKGRKTYKKKKYKNSYKKKQLESDQNSMVFSLEQFDEISVEGVFTVQINQSQEYQIKMFGDRDLLDNIDIDQINNRIELGFRKKAKFFNNMESMYKDVSIIIYTPELETLSIVGACIAKLSDFDVEKMTIDLVGSSTLEANIDVNFLEIEMTGASKMDLVGSGDRLNVEIVGVSHLDANAYRVRYANLEASGVSTIKAYVDEQVDIDESYLSKIKVRGNPKKNIKNSTDW